MLVVQMRTHGGKIAALISSSRIELEGLPTDPANVPPHASASTVSVVL